MRKHSSHHLSFEFFPPKTDDGKVNLEKNALQLVEMAPQFFSVTFGAGGSTRLGTLEAVKRLRQLTTIPVAPHLSCIGSTRDEITALLQEYKALGVRRLVALRGDMPAGIIHHNEMSYASDLVAWIRHTMGDYFHIEVAAYPECHPQSSHAVDDILHFKKKVEAGANSAITQYFYNPDAYFAFLDECAKQGIHIPIIPGIMPITNFEKLQRFSDLCGAEIPRWIRTRLEAYQHDPDSLETFGHDVVSHLCERLLAGGAPALHFYTLNQAQASVGLITSLAQQQQKKTEIMKTA